jgi:type I restriction enzyme S subunit
MENRPSESASPEIAKLFPSEFENGIPKGWRNIKLEELINTISVTHKFPKDEIVFLNTSDIFDGQVLCHKYSQVEGLPGQAKKSIKKNDILYSEIRPANKRFAYIDFDADDYVVSTKLMVLRAKSFVDPVLIYYFLKSDETISHLQMLAESRSGTFPQITFEQVKRLEMLIPNNEVLEIYSRFLKSIFEKANQNYKQNLKLAEIRDTLLPRLISGKIRVGEAENKTAKRLVKNSSEVKQNV